MAFDDINVVILSGRLTRDPEVKYTPSGRPVVRFGIAVNRSFVDSNNERQERTSFVNIVVWGAQAENCGKFLSKGSPVMVEGRLEIRKYTAQTGEDKRVTEVVARKVTFLPTGKIKQDDNMIDEEEELIEKFAGPIDENPPF